MRKTTSLLLAIIFAVTVALAVINTSMANNSANNDQNIAFLNNVNPLPAGAGRDGKPNK